MEILRRCMGMGGLDALIAFCPDAAALPVALGEAGYPDLVAQGPVPLNGIWNPGGRAGPGCGDRGRPGKCMT
ncbi:MAG: hypothetical protein MZU79_08655 [Anaerotruncus sp.]|nr:hypothetical protein [Anaerotruncus sp.]